MSNAVNVLMFGNFCVDRRQGILLHNNKHVALTPKAFEILLVLVENRDRIVPKDELMERVWPDTTVEETNVTKNISLLRKTLANGDGKHETEESDNKYIATIPKRGYRFVPEVREVASVTPNVVVQVPAVAPPPTAEPNAPASKHEPPLAAPHTSDNFVSPKQHSPFFRHRQFSLVPGGTKNEEKGSFAASIPADGTSALPEEKGGFAASFQADGTSALPEEKGGFAASIPADGTSALRGGRKTWALFAALILAGAVAVIASAFVFRKESAKIDPAKISHKLIANWKTELGADLLMGAVSPDGKFFAYSKSETGQANIYILQLTDTQPLAITRDEWPDHSPIWSHDSQQIAYLSARPNGDELWISPLLGGRGKMIHQFDSAYSRLLHWSKDEKKIFYVTEQDLFSLDLNSGQRAQLTHFGKTDQTERGFSLSPDEKSIAYVAGVDKSAQIFVASIGGGISKQLTSGGEKNISPIWFPDGKRILYASKRGDSYQLCIAYLDGRSPDQLMSTPDNTIPLHVTPDGKTVIYRVLREEVDIYQADAASGKTSTVASEGLLDIFPAASPDGTAVAFQQASNKDTVSSGNILIRSLSAEPSIQGQVENGFDVRWLGTDRLAFLRDSGGVGALWTVRSDGADARQLTREFIVSNGFSTQPYGWAQPYNYSWSPKNGLLAFSAVKSKVLNIWTVPATGGAETMITNNADSGIKLVCPIWSPDGKRLAYLAQPSAIGKATRRIVIYEQTPEGGKEQVLFETESRIRMLGWSADGSKFLFGEVAPDSRDATVSLDLKQITPGQKGAALISQFAGVYFNSLHLSPDGASAAYIARQDNRDNLWRMSLADRRPKQLTNTSDSLQHLTALAWTQDRKGIYYTIQTTTTAIHSLTNFD